MKCLHIGVTLFALVLFTSSVFVTSATSSKNSATEIEVYVYVEGTGVPVAGAYVYHHETNTLLGTTGSNGRYMTMVPSGSTIRVVEPVYGVQQHIQQAQGARTVIAVGWVLKGST